MLKNISILALAFTVYVNCAVTAFAQDKNLCRKSTEGTNFWFGFMESRNYNPNHFIEITVTSRETTTFKIFIGKEETPFNNTYTVTANNSMQVKIPWGMVEAMGSETVQNKGIHLISEKPVNVYALNWDQNSADVAVIYPVESLGHEYFAMCYTPDIDLGRPLDGNGRNSEFLIVATQDSTKIKIKPSKVTDKLIPQDSVFSVTLNKGEVYQVQSENAVGSKNSGQGDLTGSYVIADKPVAFYSGSLSTRIPFGQCCWDHLYEQIPPVQTWGREYFTVPLKSRQQDRFRILASENNTTVQITGQAPVTLNRGQFHETVFYFNEPKRILADKPILVAQFSQSRDVDRTYTGGHGDPFMIILSSNNQWKNDVTFVAYTSPVLNDQNYTGIEKYYVNIVTLTSEVSNIMVDGVPVAGSFSPFAEKNYSYAQLDITQGTHRIVNTNKDGGFLAYVYGYGGVESYGYGVGFNLDLVLDLGENITFFEKDTLLLCYGDSLLLDAGSYFDTYLWNTGAKSQKIHVADAGKYSVKTTTFDGCALFDSVYVYVSHPKIDIGLRTDQQCSPYSKLLDGTNEFEKYLWKNEFNETLSDQQKITASITGDYRLTVFDKFQCQARDTFSLTVFPVPETEVSGEKLVCGKQSALLTVSISGTPENVWNYPGSFTWTSNSKNVALSDQNIKSVLVDVSKWGEYEIYYRLKTVDGCITVDTFKIRFHPQPTSDFVFEDNQKCKGYNKKIIFTGSATDSAFFKWDLDGCQFVDTLGWQIYNVSVGAKLTKPPYVKLVIDDNGCISEPAVKPIGAEPNFIMAVDNTRGCDSLKVNFTSSLLTDDNVDFVWTFDDSDVVSAQNVFRSYPKPGFYKVNLTITNPVTQCRNGFTIDSMIRVYPTPVAKITADPTFCYTGSALLVYTNNIDSSFCNWELTGLRRLDNGNDSIVVSIEKPTGKAKLTVNEYGCVSKPFEMEIKRKPVFDIFTENDEGCQPFTLELTGTSDDNFLDYTWITDSLPYPVGESGAYFFPDTGRYSITLAAYSRQTGCSDTLVKPGWIWVHPNPYSKFEVNFPVALIENANIAFINYSERAINYFWDFGDSITSIEFEPEHRYSEIGDYTAQLIAESEFGCLDTFVFGIKIIPFTVFTPNAFRPDSNIPENKTFMPVGTGANPDRFNIKIFNRWGELMFETNSPFVAWDGNTKKGNKAPMGNYIWIAHFYDIQGYEHNQKGQVLLIR